MGLKESLEKYALSDMTSFHMPGHKGRLDPLDVTELPGLDDLYAPEGMLKEALECAAKRYGSDHCFYLVNGSTVGVLTAISAAVKRGGHLIMQRASHKSAYHAAMLRDLKLSYIYEDCDPLCGAGCGVSLDRVKDAVAADPEAEAVFITSPSYEGFAADVAAIASYLHSTGKKLIVDAAHGAHFAMSETFPQCAVAAGADMVVMSLHKTLPCPNQAALLHIKGERVSALRTNAFLSVYQTSSPSYSLMALMDECINAGYDWEAFFDRRRRLSESLKGLKNIRLRDAYDGESVSPEPCKILLCPADGESGTRLHEELRARGIEPEMSLPAYVLLICSVYDADEDYRKLAEAVKDIDSRWQSGGAAYAGEGCGHYGAGKDVCDSHGNDVQEDCDHYGQDRTHVVNVIQYGGYSIRCVKDAFAAMSLSDAWEAEYEDVPMTAAAGHISAASVMAYPPGRPILIPGEQITADILEEIDLLLKSGCSIRGIKADHVT